MPPWAGVPRSPGWTNVLCGIFQWRQDLTGLIISLVVAYASVILARKPKLEQWVIAFFNGFLIYLTIVGGTSLIPKFNTQTAALVARPQVDLHSAFARPWIVDDNLAAENRDLQTVDLQRQASFLPRRLFDGALGTLLVAGSIALLLGGDGGKWRAARNVSHTATRTLVETDGTHHIYSYNLGAGIGISIAVGFLSSLLGIGGGIIHVPILTYLLNFPVHIATATSHFVLAVMALVGTLVHVATGVFAHGVRRMLSLAIGVLLGAQLGARLSGRIGGGWILRGLAIALGFIGIRVLLQALGSA